MGSIQPSLIEAGRDREEGEGGGGGGGGGGEGEHMSALEQARPPTGHSAAGHWRSM